jgi:predicted GNAT family acetyltransferase
MARIFAFESAADFLQAAQAELETREAANGLVLGICGQVLAHPERYSSAPVWRTVEENGKLVLAAVMTPPHRLIVSPGRTAPAENGITQFADGLFREGRKLPGVFGPVELAGKFAANWEKVTGTGYRLAEQLRMYELKEVAIPSPGRGKLKVARAEDFEVVARWWCAAEMEMFGKADAEESRQSAKFRIDDGDVFLWEDGESVSMACKVRPTRKGICVGRVYTPLEMRNRGYATACVGELSRTLLRNGKEFCSLFADILNPVSNSIYQKIGYRPIGDYFEYEFLEKAM